MKGKRVQDFTPVKARRRLLSKLVVIYVNQPNEITGEVLHCAANVIRTGKVGWIRNLPHELRGPLADVFPAAQAFHKVEVSIAEGEEAVEVWPDAGWMEIYEHTKKYWRG